MTWTPFLKHLGMFFYVLYACFSLTRCSWVNAVVDLLRNVQAVNTQDALEFVRAGTQVRVKRANPAKETWVQFEDLALEIREQGKRYLKVAQAVEDILVRKEARTGDKTKLDEMKAKRIAVSKKLHTRTFHSILKSMKDLFLNSDLPALKNKIMKQKQIKEKHNKILTEQNRDMNAMALSAAPEGFMEMDISHIGKVDDPEPELAPTPTVATTQPQKAEAEEEIKPVVQERQRKKTKAAIRREQAQNFDKDDFSQVEVVQSESVSTSTQGIQVSSTIISKNAFDIGSDESILTKLSERDTVKKEPKKENKTQKKKDSGKKAKTDNKVKTTTTTTTTTKKQKQKSKSVVKNKGALKAKEMPIEEPSAINPVVLVLVGMTAVAALYYGYTMLL